MRSPAYSVLQPHRTTCVVGVQEAQARAQGLQVRKTAEESISEAQGRIKSQVQQSIAEAQERWAVCKETRGMQETVNVSSYQPVGWCSTSLVAYAMREAAHCAVVHYRLRQASATSQGGLEEARARLRERDEEVGGPLSTVFACSFALRFVAICHQQVALVMYAGWV